MICPVCGAENRAGARFCDVCGAALPSEPAREMRKVVTVLFCDVAGSTALGERLDPEAVRTLMASHFAVARAAIERHGGTVEKFIGDAVRSVFGVPTVREDDALRAVRAAVELRDATDLDVRIGVNTGDVVTGTGETLDRRHDKAIASAERVVAFADRSAPRSDGVACQSTHHSSRSMPRRAHSACVHSTAPATSTRRTRCTAARCAPVSNT